MPSFRGHDLIHSLLKASCRDFRLNDRSRLEAVIQQWEADDIIRPVADGQSLFGECLHLLTKTPLNAQVQAYLRRGAALAISEMRSG